MREAFPDQSRARYATSDATTNGPANETTPMPSDDPSRRRMYEGSTSIPARNVSTIDANEASRSSHCWLSMSKALPTAIPSVSSTRATVTPSSTETMLASRMVAARMAASWTGSTGDLRGRGTSGRSHQPEGG
jgi:hypothetical protein